MSEKTLYPLSGSMVILGLFVMAYAIHTTSLFMFLEGLFLFWMGCRITMNIWEHHRLGM